MPISGSEFNMLHNAQLFFLIVPTACYFAEAVLFWFSGDKSGALTFGAYGLANVGLIWKFLF
jgi:hypothetical protein